MATFVSMVTWHHSMTGESGIRADIDRQEVRLWGLGLHAVVFVSDEPGDSAAMLVSRCRDHAEAATIAEAILGEALIRVDSMRFDGDEERPAWLPAPVQRRQPPKPRRRREPATLAA